MNNKEFFDALALMEKERGIPSQDIAEKIAGAIVTSIKKDYNSKDIVFCDIDIETQTFQVYVRKNVVDVIEDEDTDILLEDALKIRKRGVKVGGTIDIKLDTKDFGRIAAQTAKHVIRQGIRDVERSQTLSEFQQRNQELVSAVVSKIDPKTGNAILEIGKSETILPKAEQVPREILLSGEHIKVYIVDVGDTDKGPKVRISRTHPGLVKRLLEIEVPEIYDGTVEVKSVSREAGSRTKIAVWSKDENVDAVGACIGPKGARINKIVDELGGEKIDVIKYSEDPVEYISAALSPADVISIMVAEDGSKSCEAVVPDSQLSLAIGNKGQNARLAAKLTGWKIDIHPQSSYLG